MEKKLLIGILTVLMVASASANAFGTIPSSTAKSVEGTSGNFHIDMMNLGDQSLKIFLQPKNMDNGTSVRFNVSGQGTGFRSFILEPSEVEQNPRGQGPWFLWKDGSYVKTSRVGIKAISEEARDDNIARFDILVRAAPINNKEKEVENIDPSQSVVQVREYSFKLGVNGKEVKDTPSRTEQFIQGVQTTATDFAENFLSGIRGNTGSPGSAPSAQPSPTSDTDVSVEDSSDDSDDTSESDEGSKPGDKTQEDDKAGKVSETASRQSQDQNNQGAASKSQNITGNFASQVNTTTVMLLFILSISGLYLLKVM